jgi:hypothetical protein
MIVIAFCWGCEVNDLAWIQTMTQPHPPPFAASVLLVSAAWSHNNLCYSLCIFMWGKKLVQLFAINWMLPSCTTCTQVIYWSDTWDLCDPAASTRATSIRNLLWLSCGLNPNWVY